MNKKTSLFYLIALSLFFTSCIKDTVQDLKDEGSTFVKFLNNRNNAIFFSPFSEVRKVSLFDLRKDANSNANLHTQSVVTITNVPGLVDRYNTENGTDFEQLPDSLFTLDPSIGHSGNTYTLNFDPGMFAHEFVINLNGSKWDLSRKYALGFAISSATSGNKISNGKDTLIAFLAIKNAYDGLYKYDMCTYHPSGNPNYDCGTTDVELRTVSTDAVAVYWPLGGDYGGPMIYGGGLNWFGAQCPVYTVNPGTNKVSVANSCGSVVYTTMTTASGFDSRYDPATKKFYIRYGYNYDPGPLFNAATTREWTLELTYKGPR